MIQSQLQLVVENVNYFSWDAIFLFLIFFERTKIWKPSLEFHDLKRYVVHHYDIFCWNAQCIFHLIIRHDMSHSSELEMEKQVRNMNVSKATLSYLSNEKIILKSLVYISSPGKFQWFLWFEISALDKNHFVQLVGICCNLLHVYKGFTKVSARRRFQSVVI